MGLKEEYEAYLQEEKENEKKLAVFLSKKADLENIIKKNLPKNTEFLDSLGINISIDFNRLSEKAYLTEVQREFFGAIKTLEDKGKELLDGAGYIEE